MTEWILSVEGTSQGKTLALFLALIAAVLHAAFGALQKGKHDPVITRGAIDTALILLSLPIALFLVPWPQGFEWVLVFGTLGIHFFYKGGMAFAYTWGDYTVVYPVVRGAGVFFTVFGAWIVFGEVFNLGQWIGVLMLTGAIFGLALYNYKQLDGNKGKLLGAMAFAVATGLTTAIYTTYDAYGIRTTPNPFTFVAWFFLISSFDFPIIAWIKYRRMENRPSLQGLARKSALGAVMAYGSFGSVMLATRLDKVGEAAVLRETSTIFAALIGWLVLKDHVGPIRAALMVLIAVAAITVEFMGN